VKSVELLPRFRLNTLSQSKEVSRFAQMRSKGLCQGWEVAQFRSISKAVGCALLKMLNTTPIIIAFNIESFSPMLSLRFDEFCEFLIIERLPRPGAQTIQPSKSQNGTSSQS
jgi:hypothetical protein